ncbi:MAG: FHA domain-containing protein [Variovorax sp.]|nr:FHA domain-containing protein [Variovorax sp.]
MPKILIELPGHEVFEVHLHGRQLSIGRRPGNDVVLRDPSVSGSHAVLHRVDTSTYIEDLDSTNGTHVNGERVHHQSLADGDVISVGQCLIYYLAHAGRSVDDGGHVLATPLRSVRPVVSETPSEDRNPTVRVLSGPEAGQSMALRKVVTILGRPGTASAAVAHRREGFVVVPMEGPTTLNGELLSQDTRLADGDVLRLGESLMQFRC